tara:strand:- start:76 stop:402 length:327 start_codon:yes stop_codon:yes gene_type:complete
MKKGRLKEIVSELQNASKMHLAQSKEIEKHIEEMKSPAQKRSVEDGAGLTQAEVDKYKSENPGSKLQTAVTGDVKPGSKDAKRRKAFCARSKSWDGERGKAARRRWKC